MADKWFFIMIITCMIGYTVDLAVGEHYKAQVMTACYEAAKTNQNIRCGEKDGEKK